VLLSRGKQRTADGRSIRNLASLFLLHTPLRQFLIQLFSMQSIPCRNLKNYQKSFEKELRL
jgi:hypothetical protein